MYTICNIYFLFLFVSSDLQNIYSSLFLQHFFCRNLSFGSVCTFWVGLAAYLQKHTVQIKTPQTSVIQRIWLSSCSWVRVESLSYCDWSTDHSGRPQLNVIKCQSNRVNAANFKMPFIFLKLGSTRFALRTTK